VKIEAAMFVRACARPEDLIDDGAPEVAFVGRSNVGKSSLLNRLVGRRLARTSSTPGRTRTVNWFRVGVRGWLVDLPGYGFARVSRAERRAWGETVEAYFARRAEGLLVVQLVDAGVGATALDVEAIEWLRAAGHAPLAVATKVDRLKRGERARALARIRSALGLAGEADLLAASAETGEGVRELRQRVEEFLAAAG
jgi:GTP-binding protein